MIRTSTVVFGASLLLVVGGTAAAAQQPAVTTDTDTPAPIEQTAAVTGADRPATAEPLAGAAPGFTYLRGGRRDPFVSLVRRGSDAQGPADGARLRGLVGLRVSEVALRGTLESRGGYVGIVQGADSRTYIVRPGDRLADGAIQTIMPDAMVILQQVDDPLSRERQREIRKPLRQTDEGRP